MRVLKVVQVVTCLNDATGGPAVSVTELAASLARLGHHSSIVALDYPELGPARRADPAEVFLHQAPFFTRRIADWSPALLRLLKTATRGECDIVHNHGLWLQPNRYARLTAKAVSASLVISPRGMLESWARGQKRLKKWVGWHLFEAANIHAATAFHATSVEEARSIRDCGVRAPIAIIPNGVGEATLALDGDVPERSLVPGPPGGRYVLFMSRLHPKKGLEMLLSAWAALRSDFPDVRLLVVGPDLTGYTSTLRRRAQALGIEESVTFHGALDGRRKAAAYAHAAVFVLPSFSENFGIVVGEALAHGIPVVTTTATPWRSLEANKCGWWVDPNVDAIRRAIREALSLSEAQCREYGERARALARSSDSWDVIATKTAAFYRWIRDDRCSPSTAPPFLAG